MQFRNESTKKATDTADWDAIRRAILARLDIPAEYKALGVRFSNVPPNAKGILPCHAMGREDATPSAMINTKTGIYHDSGGSGETLNFWDFALRFGGHGRWIDAIKHYAVKAGVDMPTPKYSSGGRIREAVYDYRDASGVLRDSVLRYRQPNGKKTFSQHPPDGKGGYKFGPGCMDGIEPLPYRLPELLSAPPEEPLFVVEGEKDADRLASLGLVATTNHQGAMSTDRTWPKFLPEWFAGRTVYIIPDNDPGGVKHAHGVAGYLHQVAASVTIVTLPDVPPKGDFSDWIDAVGAQNIDVKGGLLTLASSITSWSPDAIETTGPEPTGPEPEPERWADLSDVRKVHAEARWSWDLWIPSGNICGIAAFEGIGKSRLALDLCRRAYLGLPWPDGSPMTLPVGSRSIWLCSDGNQDELARFAPEFGLPDDAIYFPSLSNEPYGGTDLDDPDTIQNLAMAAETVRPAFVVIDTITTATGRDLCSQQAMKPLKTALLSISQGLSTSILALLHLNQQGSVLGRRIKGITRTLMILECPDPNGAPEVLRLKVDKSFDRKPAPLSVRMGSTGNEYADGGAAPPAVVGGARPPGRPSVERDRARQYILNASESASGIVLVELLNEFMGSGGAKNTFFRARDELILSGEITCSGKPMIIRRNRTAPVLWDGNHDTPY